MLLPIARVTQTVLLSNNLKLLTSISAIQGLLVPRLTRRVHSSRAVKGEVIGNSPVSSRSSNMELQRVVAELHKMYPPCLAEDWDNVGLLVEPSSDQQQVISHVFLTNDLTEQVMEEIDKAVPKVGLVIAYHPPIFKPLKTLTRGSTKERIIVKALEKRMAIYSPHTAADSVCGGVNDWLAEGLGSGKTKPLRPVAPQYDVMAYQLTGQQCEAVRNVTTQCGVKWQEKLRDDSNFDITVRCKLDILPQVYTLVSGQMTPHNLPVCVVPCKDDDMKNCGVGRVVTLSEPASLSDVVQRVKNHLALSSVRLAIGRGGSEDTTMVNTIAICAGSGATVLRGVKADVFLTGEMSHHEVLDATSRGVSVILCEHSNTERGYLTVMKHKLQQVLGNDIIISVSDIDCDPLVIV